MAGPNDLYDSHAVASEIAADLLKKGGLGLDESQGAGITALFQPILENRLNGYNAKFINLHQKLEDDAASAKASYTSQIKDLKNQIKKQKQQSQADLDNLGATFRKDRDDLAKRADKDRSDIEQERLKLTEIKQKAKAEVEKYKKDAHEAVEDKEGTIKLWEETKGDCERLKGEIASLQKSLSESQDEVKNWEAEAEKVANLRELAEGELAGALKIVDPLTQKSQELTREITSLKSQLNTAKKTVNEQAQKIRKLENELKTTTEQLESYKAKSRESTPNNDPTGTAASELGDLSGGSSTPRSGSAVSAVSRTSELEREKEENKKLREKMETDYILREVHKQTLDNKTKEVADLKTEIDRLQTASTNCQEALKKLRDETSKKESAEIKALKARIRDLEKQIAASDAAANKHKGDLARIQDLEKQLNAARERITKLEKLERELRTEIANQQTKISELKNKPNKQPGSDKGEGDDTNNLEEVARLEKELAAMTDQCNRFEREHTDLITKKAALGAALEQRDVAYDWLSEQLHETQDTCDRIRKAVERMLQPNCNIATLDDFSEGVRSLVKRRQGALNAQERLIPMALKAAAEYRNITGRGFAIEGHDISNEGQPFISYADHFLRDIQGLYDTLLESVRVAQGQNDGQNDTAAQETIRSLREQIKTLDKKTKDLERQLKVSQDNAAKYEDPGTNQSQVIQNIRDLIKQFLTVTGPSLGDIDNLLANLVNLQKTVPGAVPFGEETERKARQLDATLKLLDESKAERAKLLDRNRTITRNLDDLQKTHNNLQKTHSGLQRAHSNLQQAHKNLQYTYDDLQKTYDDLKTAYDDLQKSYGTSKQERTKLLVEVARLTGELKALRGNQTGDNDQARRKLEEDIGRISGELQMAKASGDDERAKHEKDITALENQLKTVQARLEQERTDFAEQIKARDDNHQALRDGDIEEAARLGSEVARLNTELKTAEDNCERERRRLEKEIKQLTADLQKLQTSNARERTRHGNEERRLAIELRNLRNTTDEERKRLEQEVARLNTEVARLNDEVARLNDEVARLNDELEALRTALGEQNNVIGDNGQQAKRTEEALSRQIAVFHDAQGEIMRSIQNMRDQAVPQGRSAAETGRTIRRARAEIDMFKNLVQQLTVERDLLQDEVRLCQEAQRRGRERLRAANADGNNAGNDNNANNANNVRIHRRVIAGVGRFIRATYDLFLRAVQHGTVWGTLGTLFFMMVAVIIAEGRMYAEWKNANAHSRALWMTTSDRSTVCLGTPNLDYFWHTVFVILSGRWAFRA